ncbi:DUF4494 domain-containing protein [Nafulsella turpanensis]|uniref:DUF4494 domain-containing protein n=1 Tax=Nafulsella turpanensis TaxID=1265690 RepID=UPI0004760605|nr:DUF4494 domain-containing protein [Nafulsella turpanensis]
MKIWFQCKIKYQKEEENGKIKNVSEPYLVDAVSYTEAEARIYEELGSVIRGEFEVTSITKSRFVDIFHYDDNDVWYKCKVTYMVADENSGKEKKITNMMLVTAANVKEAYDRIQESLSTMLVPFEIPEIAQSPIVEIFPYVSEEDREQVIPENLRPLSEVEAEARGVVRPIPPGPAEIAAMNAEDKEAENVRNEEAEEDPFTALSETDEEEFEEEIPAEEK